MTGTFDGDGLRPARPESRRPDGDPRPAAYNPQLPSTITTREARRANAGLTPTKARSVTGKKPKPTKPEKAVKQAKPATARTSAKAAKSSKPAKPAKPATRSKGRTARNRAPGRFDGNRALTISVASLAVLSLVVVGILLWVKNQNPTVERSMFAAYVAQQAELDKVAAGAASDIDAFAELHEESTELNAAAATALAALVGFADEPPRLAAETARVAFESSIAAQTPVAHSTETDTDTDALTEDSSVEELARGINQLNAEAVLIETEAETAAEALDTLTATRDTFVAALLTFAQTIPPTATAVIDENPDAGASFEDAVTAAVTALTVAIEAGEPGVAELQAYATAAAAMQAEQARLDAESAAEPDTDTEDQVAPRATPRAPSRPPVTAPPATTPPVDETAPPATTPPVEDTAPVDPAV